MRRLLILAVPMLVCWTALMGQQSTKLFRQFFENNAITENEFVEMGLQTLISSGSLKTSQDEARTELIKAYQEGLKQGTEAKIEELKQFKLLVDEINKQKKKSLFGNLAQAGLALVGAVTNGVEVARADKQAKEQQQEIERQQYQQQLEQHWASQQNASTVLQSNTTSDNRYLQQQQQEQQKNQIRQQLKQQYPTASSRDIELEVERLLSQGISSIPNPSSQSTANSRKISGTLYYSVDGQEYTESIMLEVLEEGNRMYVKSYRLPKRLTNTLDPDGVYIPVNRYAEDTKFNIDGFKANDHKWKIMVEFSRTALNTNFGTIYF